MIPPKIGQQWYTQGGVYVGSRLKDGEINHQVIPGGPEHDIEEAAKVPRQYAEQLDALGWGNRFPDELAGIFNASTNMTNIIRALKSDAKGAGS